MAGNYLMDLTSVGGSRVNHTVRHGQASVVTAGTAVPLGTVPLGTVQAISAVTIKALAANAGVVYVGGSTVDETNGFELAAGEAVLVVTDDLANVYIDCQSGNTDGVSWLAS